MAHVPDSVLAKEMAFQRAPRWWYRAYLALKLLATSRYAIVPAKNLEEGAKRFGVSGKTIRRGIEDLIKAGLAEKNKFGYYELKPSGIAFHEFLEKAEEHILRNKDPAVLRQYRKDIEPHFKEADNNQVVRAAKEYIDGLIEAVIYIVERKRELERTKQLIGQFQTG